MKTVEQITRSYAAECVNCGTRGPYKHTRQAAEQAATENGWKADSYWNGLRWFSNTLCPNCWEETDGLGPQIREEGLTS